ncbi:transglycosylase domain-containing protein [Streptomyces sp. NPDC001594]|uniref:transglycosylase domain-containing protein n=1 Tax=Streptomyces sp. NPDC001594 TaxID=3364590 RepID=UPI00369963E2
MRVRRGSRGREKTRPFHRPARGRGGPPGGPKKREGWRRLVPRRRTALWCALGGTLAFIGALVAGYFLVDVPDPNEHATSQGNVWEYADGSVIARTGAVNRNSVPLDAMSKAAQQATLAAEHRDFYKDPAISVPAIARAVAANVTGGTRQGGSTITQQFVKNHYLTQDISLTRKFKELFIAVKVGQRMSKDDILQSYLNTNYYGRGAYGIQAAAQAYYGVNAADLNAEQGAYLATLLNAPALYDVKKNPRYRDRALARWTYVMDGMADKDWLTPAERATARFPEPLDFKPSAGQAGQAGYLIDAARQYLLAHKTVTEAELEAGGFTIRTTFDKRRQDALAQSVTSELGATLRPDTRKGDENVRVGAASVDNATGNVLAVYGGPDYVKQYVNDATRRDVQAGSTFKPFALAAALEEKAKDGNGRPITPGSLYDGDNGYAVRETGYRPGNQGQRDYGRVSVRRAMVQSVNTVFTQLAQDAGLRNVRGTSVALGLPDDTPELAAVPSLPLGVATPSAVDMAGAYATLANHGLRNAPRMVDRLTAAGADRHVPEVAEERAVSARTADTVTDVLRDVVDDPEGTGRAAKELGRASAGKTGTTNEKKSVWYVGYTPQISTSVALFREAPVTHAKLAMDTLGGESVGGGTLPARIWTAYNRTALEGEPAERFTAPGGVVPDGGQVKKKTGPSGGPEHKPKRGTTPPEQPAPKRPGGKAPDPQSPPGGKQPPPPPTGSPGGTPPNDPGKPDPTPDPDPTGGGPGKPEEGDRDGPGRNPGRPGNDPWNRGS